MADRGDRWALDRVFLRRAGHCMSRSRPGNQSAYGVEVLRGRQAALHQPELLGDRGSLLGAVGVPRRAFIQAPAIGPMMRIGQVAERREPASGEVEDML